MSNIYKVDLVKIRQENLKEVFKILEEQLHKLQIDFYLLVQLQGMFGLQAILTFSFPADFKIQSTLSLICFVKALSDATDPGSSPYHFHYIITRCCHKHMLYGMPTDNVC